MVELVPPQRRVVADALPVRVLAGAGMEKPTLLEKPPPTYSREAMAGNFGGVALVKCTIGVDGRLVGYGGGLERKRWLLAHEGVRSGMLL